MRKIGINILKSVSFSFLLIGSAVYCQDSTYYKYELIIDKAFSLSDSGEFTNACNHFDSAFQLINFVPYHHFDAFQAAVQDSNIQRAYSYLVQCALQGLDIDYFSAEELIVFNNSELSVKYYGIKDSLLQEHYKSIDLEYYQALVFLKERDQEVRSSDNPTMQKNDSLNFSKLFELTMEKGFPTFEKTGYGFNMAWLILWHHRGKTYPNEFLWPKIIRYIQLEIDNGKITPRFFEIFEDAKLKLR